MTLYHFKDPIKNFVIKLELRRLSPLFTLQEDRQQQQQQQQQQTPLAEPEYEIWEFRWQEKAFSQNEEELYSDIRNCYNNLTTRYHERIVELRETGTRPNGRLFSYTNQDNFTDLYQLSAPILTDNSIYARKLVTSQSLPRDRPTASPVVNLPLRNVEYGTKSVMYIMADLRRKDTQQPDEKVVCTVTLVETGTISVCPDFSEKWIRVDNLIGDTWEFKITHISNLPSRKDKEREENVLNEIFERQNTALLNAIGQESFLTPELEKDEAIFSIFGEICSCYGFKKSSAYVKFQLALPGAFQLLGTENEECYTNQGSLPFSPSFTPQEISIGHLFEYRIKGPINYFDHPTLNKPYLLFEVNSLDSWGRHSNLGYGSLFLELSPGAVSTTVHTWRLSSTTKWQQLSEYFLGVTPVLSNLDKIRFPSDFSDQNISKLGWRTETSGKVKLKLQIVRQKIGLENEMTLPPVRENSQQLRRKLNRK